MGSGGALAHNICASPAPRGRVRAHASALRASSTSPLVMSSIIINATSARFARSRVSPTTALPIPHLAFFPHPPPASLPSASPAACHTMTTSSLVQSVRAHFLNAADAFFRFFVLDFLSRGIAKGHLELQLPHQNITFGEPKVSALSANRPVVCIRVNKPSSFFFRIATAADIGLAEAYMAHDMHASAEQLLLLFKLLILNRDHANLSVTQLTISKLGAACNRAMHLLRSNTLSGSSRNIAAHYDLSNQLFACFLGESWTYSCAMFERSRDLDQAQWRKLDVLIDKARIDQSCHVLEVGCGWGEFAIRAAQRTGCRVTGITLSDEQLVLGRQRVRDAGVQQRVQLLRLDYRQLQSLGVKFDRMVSIEMMEAVGHEFLATFFREVSSVLTAEALAVVQVITTPEERYEQYRRSTDFIQKYIFPGGVCPSVEALISAAARSALCLEHAENIGPHYASTLREWRQRFERSVKDGRVRAAGFDERFERMWRYYLCYCEAGFDTRTLGDMQLVLSRASNVATLRSAPQPPRALPLQ
eukprot:TRINITY_DN2583_c0_g1_i1.p1 TRINITY_DN2583_c0_g1~~TRINITY_DN2583_c0_g1_i1.p1  ORF type:complete len:531 (+),score=98.42 TRINITY_DN2583_c0_g1_i1:5514-7106(+)